MDKSLLILAILVAVTAPWSSHAEYRAFELAIINTATGQSRKVISTLDQIQYPEYYPLNKDEVATYVTSWMCWEDSPHLTPTCEPPENPAAATSEAARLPATPQ